MENNLTVLYLFESVIPRKIDLTSLGFGEMTVLASLPQVNQVVGIGRSGKTYYEHHGQRQQSDNSIFDKISTIQIPYTGSPIMYWLSPIILFIYGFQYIKKFKINVIHAESCYLSGIAAILLGKIFHIPVIIENHATYEALLEERFRWMPVFLKKRFWNFISSLIYSNANCICANSQTSAQLLAKKFPQKNVHWYIPAINVPPKKISNHKFTISFIGRLYPDKGALYFLQSLVAIRPQLVKYHVHVLIAGDGPEKARLQEFIQLHRLNMVNLVGTQDRWEILQSTNVLVNTTIVKAALEMVIVEAAAIHIPTICFGDSHYPETVIHNETGIKVPYKDVKALSLAIKDAINSSETICQWGENACSYYKSTYATSIQVRNVSKMYQQLSL